MFAPLHPGRARSGLRFALVAAAVTIGPPLFYSQTQAEPKRGGSRLVCDWLIDDFSASRPGHFPVGWRTKDPDDMPLARDKRLYEVEQDGNRRVLHATYRDEAITIGKKVQGWNLAEYPVLSWEWKAIKLPKGGNEDSVGSNDCAAAVYAFWDIGFPFYVDSAKYSWSSTLKIGRELKKRLGHDHVRVTASGLAASGQWQKVQVDLRKDHERWFGKELRSPSGIAVLTDADATESEAEAYYADFRLCRYR